MCAVNKEVSSCKINLFSLTSIILVSRAPVLLYKGHPVTSFVDLRNGKICSVSGIYYPCRHVYTDLKGGGGGGGGDCIVSKNF